MKGIELLQGSREEERVPMMFFLTDGEATAGVQDSKQIVADVSRKNEGVVNVYSLAFGAGADYQLLRQVSGLLDLLRQVSGLLDLLRQVSGLLDLLGQVSGLLDLLRQVSGLLDGPSEPGLTTSCLDKSVACLICSDSSVACLICLDRSVACLIC